MNFLKNITNSNFSCSNITNNDSYFSTEWGGAAIYFTIGVLSVLFFLVFIVGGLYCIYYVLKCKDKHFNTQPTIHGFNYIV